MSRWLIGSPGLTVALFILAVAPWRLRGSSSQDQQALQRIPDTELRVSLPANWQLAGAAPPGTPQLRYSGNPEYSLTVSQTTPATKGNSCMDLIGSMQAVPGLGATVLPRPRFIPEVYFGSALEIPKAQLTCLNTGTGTVGVMIQVGRGDAKPDLLTPMLVAIADAATKESKAVSAPANLKLPLLGIEIPLKKGTWGVRAWTDQWGTNDNVGRAAHPRNNELHITPFILKTPGRCQSLMANRQFGSAKLVKGPQYTGTRWHPDTLEQFPPPFKALQAYACRNVSQNSVLLARIDYEKPSFSDEDVSVVRQMLEDVGDAVERKSKP